MTLLQRDRENIELGREQGTLLATKIIKLYNKGMNNKDIADSLQLDSEYVNSVISDYENDQDMRGTHKFIKKEYLEQVRMKQKE